MRQLLAAFVAFVLLGAAPYANLPSKLPSLAAWYDFSNASTVTASGGKLSQITDLSGNGETLAQASSGSQPGYGSTTINGLNTVNFTGSQVILSNDTTFSRLFFMSTGMTMAFVQYPANGSADTFEIWSGSATPFFNFENGIYWDWSFGQGSPSRLHTSGSSTAPHIWVLNATPSATENIWLDGSLLTSGSTNAVTSYNCPLAVGDAAGCSESHGSSPWSGQLGEIVLYSSQLTSNQQQEIVGYLACKWKLQANLPASHPYRNRCPYFPDAFFL